MCAEIAIDNSSSKENPDDSGLTELREKIIEVAKRQPYWGEKRPIKWLLLADKLDKVREDLQRKGAEQQIALSEVETFGKELGLKDEEEVLAFLQFHHNLGDLIHFSDAHLCDTVILSPQWLVTVFRYQ